MNSLLYLWTFVAIAAESFPISSSGHAYLISYLFALVAKVPVLEVPYRFDHLLHVTTALILPLVFYHAWRPLLNVRRSWRIILKIISLGFVVEACTATLYFIVDWYGLTLPLWVGFVITSLLLISLRWCPQGEGSWNVRSSILIGCAQGCALFPGISRLGSTYVVARWTGLPPEKAVQLSFLIEWPVAVAGLCKGLYDLQRTPAVYELLNCWMLLVMVGASICFYYGLKFFLQCVKQRTVWLFGLYVMCVSFIAWYSQ